jgi:hypothetical protein
MATRMQQRRGTAAQWTAANPILAAGEIGFETDTNKFKVGDGTNTWSNLTYFVDASIAFDSAEVNALVTNAVNAVIDGAPNALNTLNEIAAALNDDPNLYTTLTNLITEGLESVEGDLSAHEASSINVHGIANTAALATQSYADTQVSTHNSETINVHGIANTNDLATMTYADGAVSTHNSATINVHGIANTAALSTKSYADEASSNAVSTHNSATTSVHGIANTAVLATQSDVSNAQTNAQSYADSLASDYDAAGSAANAQSAAESYADGAVSTHNLDTTNVHGISDTAQLAYLNANTQTFTGSIEIDNNLTVDGNFIVNGSNVLVSATQIQIEDTLLQLGHTNAGNTTDLGLVTSYNDGTQKHSGLVKDVTDGKWKLFDGVTTEPATTVDFTQGSLDTLALKFLEANTVTVSSGVAFSDGTQSKEGIPSRTAIIAKTDSYTLSALTERDSLIEVNKASAATITIPTNSAVAYPVGTSIDILQVGAGQVTIAGDTGVTVNGTPGLKLRTQWSSATLFKRDTNTWVVMGDLAS